MEFGFQYSVKPVTEQSKKTFEHSQLLIRGLFTSAMNILGQN